MAYCRYLSYELLSFHPIVAECYCWDTGTEVLLPKTLLTLRSLVEPIRKILSKNRGHFIEAYAEDIDMSNKLVLVSQTDMNGEKQQCYVPYDKLVIGVGSSSNTHGIDGVEHVHFLKTIADARGIRNRIMDNFERACLPSTTEEERKELLSFVVAGGGPTGVEFASELFDMMEEDLSPYVSPFL